MNAEPETFRSCPYCGARYGFWIWAIFAGGHKSKAVACQRCGKEAIVSKSTGYIAVFAIFVPILIVDFILRVGRGLSVLGTLGALLLGQVVGRLFLVVERPSDDRSEDDDRVLED
jgi:hypothetical protein